MNYNENNTNKFVIGIDFGTDSCRALVVNTFSGEEIAFSTSFYKRWKEGFYCDSNKNQYRHHPKDYIQSFQEAVCNVLAKLPANFQKNVVAIGIDATASTVAITNNEGTPMGLLPKHAENPNAMFLLWKDHTAIKEADEINVLSHKWDVDYTSLSGGTYSLEWFWAKVLHILRNDNTIYNEAYAAIELCDWIPALLTGILKPEEVKRSRCAAGHKCLWAEEWGGYPSNEFLSTLDPQLAIIKDHLSDKTYTNEKEVGTLSSEWAEKLGLSTDVVISVGIVDAHAAAIGAGIKPGTMVKIVGTSTCDIVVIPKPILGNKKILGISGQVDGSVIPDLIGIEAGQAAFGDVYAWFRDILGWVLDDADFTDENKHKIKQRLLENLTEKAESISTDDTSLVSLDWLNGRRTPFSDPTKKGAITGITLSTTAPHIYKSLVESTAFGSKAIFEHYKNEGLNIVEIVCVGGIPQKSPYIMQTLSNVLGVPIMVSETKQAGALGAAMCAATATGLFSKLEKAQSKMGSGILRTYYPNEDTHMRYNKLYQEYIRLGSI